MTIDVDKGYLCDVVDDGWFVLTNRATLG
jgi:hypothetical protein